MLLCAMVCSLLTDENTTFEDLTQNHSRSNCPTGQTSIFTKTDNCFIGSQQYCCPSPPQLTACHWVGGSGGKECANAVCNATELEVDRAQFGGSSIGGCSCKFARPDLATNPSFRLDKWRFACQLNLFDRGKIEGSLLYRTKGAS